MLVEKDSGHGKRIVARDHFRRIYETSEIPAEKEIEIANELFQVFEKHGACLDNAERSWYKLGDDDIPIITADRLIIPLSEWSNLIAGLKPISQWRVYVNRGIRKKAERCRDKLLSKF